MRGDDAGLESDQFALCKPGGAEDCDLWERAAHHGDFVAGVEAGAVLAVFVDFVRQGRPDYRSEAEVEEEVGNAGEEADGGDALLFGFGEQLLQQLSTGTLTFGCRFDHDGADFG